MYVCVCVCGLGGGVHRCVRVRNPWDCDDLRGCDEECAAVSVGRGERE